MFGMEQPRQLRTAATGGGAGLVLFIRGFGLTHSVELPLDSTVADVAEEAAR
eukprot:gene8090-3203_t